MEPWALYDGLLALARTLGLPVRIEDLSQAGSAGGLCKLKGQYLILVDESATLAERIGSLIGALAQVDTEDVQMAPAVRDKLEQRRDVSVDGPLPQVTPSTEEEPPAPSEPPAPPGPGLRFTRRNS